VFDLYHNRFTPTKPLTLPGIVLGKMGDFLLYKDHFLIAFKFPRRFLLISRGGRRI
jgi:hypothetical protein